MARRAPSVGSPMANPRACRLRCKRRATRYTIELTTSAGRASPSVMGARSGVVAESRSARKGMGHSEWGSFPPLK